MHDKPLTIATYAAGASLAAVTLVYVFAPTFFLDGDFTHSSTNSRKKTIVGLSNPANDCFINAVLQALAGLGDLRVYLIRETHRRSMDGLRLYKRIIVDPIGKGSPPWKVEGLQLGIVTQGLKDILNALNERPIHKKTISAGSFIKVLEDAFRQRISPQQQDAQEFLQVVAERLCDEYHAGKRVRDFFRSAPVSSNQMDEETSLDQDKVDILSENCNNSQGVLVQKENSNASKIKNPGPPTSSVTHINEGVQGSKVSGESEVGFPLEGESESQIECLTCGFKPKPTTTTFCSLTLNVPQVSSTTLSSCFDQMFKTEYIEDFRCEKCRLVHALQAIQASALRAKTDELKLKAQKAIEEIKAAIDKNPEGDLSIEMPHVKFAPKRKIARYIRITRFPKIMAIHLSRSIFDAGHSTTKNSAKVSFPEQFPLGGLLNQKFYHLSSVVCHKGSHNSGHYESFRRQTINAPFSTPNTFNSTSIYSKSSSPVDSCTSTQHENTIRRSGELPTDSCSPSVTLEHLSPTSTSYSISSLPEYTASPSNQACPDSKPPKSVLHKSTDRRETAKLRSRARSVLSKVPSLSGKISDANGVLNRPIATGIWQSPKKGSERWWRISDDKIKECKTSEVLGMQREVYLLFYELDR
ncbi:unnamed protein product [Blumeria hordei]|uniref:Ubiquitin carboxyl-terminal hydrolase n=1 Tax=Blumeria hordei TaxID=2867405 RepID=A0A383UZD3_BLUHO|nr:unnamed protein product [Blumeria hordei]